MVDAVAAQADNPELAAHRSAMAEAIGNIASAEQRGQQTRALLQQSDAAAAKFVAAARVIGFGLSTLAGLGIILLACSAGPKSAFTLFMIIVAVVIFYLMAKGNPSARIE